MTIPPCPYCEKTGLPILLTRYGIAPSQPFAVDPAANVSQAAAPQAATFIGDPQPAVPLDASCQTHYTVRSLRGGYVYVYYEVNKHWEAYTVDSDARLSQVMLSDTPPPARTFHASCQGDPRKAANAALLTVPDPETAGKVWLGFSDAWWTAAVRKANESENARKQHMRCIDVQGWYNHKRPSKAPPQSAPITAVDAMVADYAMPVTDGALAFFWSPFPYLARQDEVTALKTECQRLCPNKGLVIVLDDPVGLAQELPALIDKRWSGLLRQKDQGDPVHPGEPWGRKLSLNADLATLQQHVEKQAEAKAYADARQLHQDVEWSDGDGMPVPNTALLLPSYRNAAQAILDEQVSETDLAAARAKRWGAYEKRFDADQRKAFNERFAKAATQHDAQFTHPLAKTHAAWLRSTALQAVFEHHFDPDDINTGVAFAGTVLACMAGTGGVSPCIAVYEDWLQQPVATSPLWRAMLFNHTPLLHAVNQASDGKEAPFTNIDDWSNLFAVYVTAINGLKFVGVETDRVASVDVLPAMLHELGALPVKVLMAGGHPAMALQAVLGLHAGQPVRWVRMMGTRRHLYTAVLEVTLESQPNRGVSLSHLQQAVDEQLRTLSIEVGSLDEELRAWMLVFDDTRLKAIAQQRMTPAQRADALAKSLKLVSVSNESFIGVKAFRDSTLAKTVEYARLPGALASVGLVLSLWGLHSAYRADASATRNQPGHERALLKIGAMYATTIGSLIEVVRTGAVAAAGKSIPWLSPWLAARVERKGFRMLEGTGSVFGGAGLIICAVIDVENLWEAKQRQERGMAALYFLNAAAETYVGGNTFFYGLNLLFGFGWEIDLFSPWILFATAAILVVGVLIELEKDPPTMDWTRRCLWGPDSSYQTEAEETDTFRKALNAEVSAA